MEQLVASGRAPAPPRQPTFNELLIQEVRAHPELYDQQHRVCTDNGERNFTWEVIAARIDRSISGEFAKKRWLQMRDRYRKELKMALRNMIAPKWPYFRKLAWLDPYLKDTKNASISSSAPLFGGDLSPTAEHSDVQPSLFESSGYLPAASSINDESSTRGLLLKNIVAAAAAAVRLPPSDDSSKSCLSHMADDRCSQSPPDSSAAASTSGESSGPTTEMPARSAVAVESRHFGSTDGDDVAGRRQRAGSTASASSSSGVDCSDASAASKPARSAFTTPPSPSSNASPALVDLNLAVLHAAAAAAAGSIHVPPAGKPAFNSTRTRHRNPPYLVRRGGTVRVRNSAFSLVRPSFSPSPGGAADGNFEASAGAKDLLTRQFPTVSPNGASLWNLLLSRSDGTMNSWMTQLQQLAANVAFGQPPSVSDPPADSSGVLNLSRDAIKIEVPPSLGEEEPPEKLWQDAKWLDDEDLLFARLVVVRLRRLSAGDRRLLRAQISEWIDRHEARSEVGGLFERARSLND